MTGTLINSLVKERQDNIIRVDFRREPDDHPNPRFPGGAAARPPIPQPYSKLESVGYRRLGNRRLGNAATRWCEREAR